MRCKFRAHQGRGRMHVSRLRVNWLFILVIVITQGRLSTLCAQTRPAGRRAAFTEIKWDDYTFRFLSRNLSRNCLCWGYRFPRREAEGSCVETCGGREGAICLKRAEFGDTSGVATKDRKQATSLVPPQGLGC